MPFLSVSLTNFRNLKDETFDFNSKEIFFVGVNGQGKSNLLEALYILAYGNSFRAHTESEIIKNGEKFCLLKTLFRSEDEKGCTINFKFDGKKREIEKNTKKIKDRKEILNTIPCIIFSHEDLDFVIGEPERKRFFFDQTLSMYDILYIDTIRKYKKILKTRNSVLKSKNYDLLDALDVQLAETGSEICQKREKIIFNYNVFFADLYKEISGIEDISLYYSSSWKTKSVNEIITLLEENREQDKALEYTSSGIHRDNILFVKNKKNFVHTASTGQRRLLALLLRIIQAKFYFSRTQRNPILLLDDVLLELDQEKRNKVMQLLPDYDQLFCTFLPTENYDKYKKSGTKVFFINQGECSE